MAFFVSGARSPARGDPRMSEKITAELRTEFGKGAARRIRREDKVPAVMYGHGNDPIHLTLPGHDTMMAIKHGGANTLLELDLDGTTQLALTKQVQVDPVRRDARARRLRGGPPRREGDRRRPDRPGRRGRPRHAGRHRELDRPGRGGGHPHPRVVRGQHRGRRGRHPVPGRLAHAAVRHDAAHRPRDPDRQRDRRAGGRPGRRARGSRPPRARGAEGEAAEGDEAAEGGESAEGGDEE